MNCRENACKLNSRRLIQVEHSPKRYVFVSLAKVLSALASASVLIPRRRRRGQESNKILAATDALWGNIEREMSDRFDIVGYDPVEPLNRQLTEQVKEMNQRVDDASTRIRKRRDEVRTLSIVEIKRSIRTSLRLTTTNRLRILWRDLRPRLRKRNTIKSMRTRPLSRTLRTRGRLGRSGNWRRVSPNCPRCSCRFERTQSS